MKVAGIITFQKLTLEVNPAGIYLLKDNNGNTRTWCDICSKLTIKKPERRDCARVSFLIKVQA